MSFQHDPELHANYLRQCLAEDPRAIGLFLGAGCPCAVRTLVSGKDVPLIPAIAGITSAVEAALLASSVQGSYKTAVAHFAQDGRPNPNVEALLTHIRSLRQVAGKDKVRGLAADELDSLDREVCAALVTLTDRPLPAPPTPYHQIAAWIGAIERREPVEIFTTNYDLLIEQALETHRVPYFDGFVGSRSAFLDLQAMEDDKLPARWARLWKIHGSLNWHEDDKGLIYRGESTGGHRVVIYPSHLKYDQSRRMPHLAMIDRERAFLRKTGAVMVVCGYSFGDEHLNEVINLGLQGNPTASVFAFLYGDLSGYPSLLKLAKTRPNLSALAPNEAVIGTRLAPWTGGKKSGSRDSIAVRWVDDPANPSMKNATFTLGNFSDFGAFAEDLIGIRNPSAKP